MFTIRRISFFLSLVLLCAWPVLGQGERGAITGMVKDPMGAVVVGADVTATNLATNVASKARTTDAGVYRIPYLPPGNYEVSVNFSGFKRAVMSPAIVTVGGVTTADFALEIGAAADSITVSADATALDTSTATVERSISSDDYHSWPIQVQGGQRNLQAFVFNSLPGAVGNAYMGSINGGQYFSHETMIEGMSIGRMDVLGASNMELTLSADAVNEFKLQTGTMGAQYGGTQGGMANFSVRSGTNQYHGTAYDYFGSDYLNARTFTQNATGASVMPQHENNFGATLGGPVRIPKLYDGRNKTFFFFSYEGDRRRQYALGGKVSLPTQDFLNGDFSKLLDPTFTQDATSGTQVGTDALGRPVIAGTIYDPNTTRYVNGEMVRDPFQGNVIPQSAFSTVSKNVLGAGSLPTPLQNTLLNNYPSLGGAPVLNVNSFSGKLEQVFSEKHRMAFFASVDNRDNWAGVPTGFLPVPGSVLGPFKSQSTVGTLVRVTEDWVIQPTLLNHFGLGYNRFTNYQLSLSADQNWPEKIGLTGVGQQTLPAINFMADSATAGGQMAPLGNSFYGGGANGSTIVQDDLTWLHGAHSFKFGAEARKYYFNERPLWGASGTFDFYAGTTGLPAYAGQTGFSFASFLLGTVNDSDLSIYTVSPGHRTWYPAFYVNDDWRVNKRLTLNLGLRWDIVGGTYEVAGRSSSFDPTLTNPATGTLGAIRFLQGSNQKSFQNTNFKEFAPRVGFAYQLKEAVVLRGGYSMIYSPPVVNGWGYNDSFGYNAGNPVYGSWDGSVAYNWDSGYPAYPGKLPNLDPTIQNYAGASYIAPDSTREPYVQSWNLGFQFMLPSKTVLDVTYVGNKGTHLDNPNYANMKQMDPKYMSLGKTLLTNPAGTPYMPYASYPTEGDLAYVEYALRPYPQYTSLSYMYPLFGNSFYNALQIQATKRMGKGLSFLVGYSWSKAISDSDSAVGDGVSVGTQNQYDRRAERSVTSFNYPQDLKLTWVYEMPFGKGKAYLNNNRVVDAIVGGWTVTANQEYRSGAPLIPTSSRNGGYMGAQAIRPNLNGGVPIVQDAGGLDSVNGTPYINPAAFSPVPTFFGNMAAQFGNAPRVLPNLRGPAWQNENFGIFKRFTIKEGKNVELRADAFNALNRAGRGNPVMNVSSPLFGRIFNPGHSTGRQIQVALRINY